MTKRILLGTALSLGAFSAGALGQAGAESALTNATSATSVAGVGPRLGHTLDQTTKKLSDRVQNNVGQSAQSQSEKKPSSPAPSQSSKPAAAPASSAAQTAGDSSQGTPMPMTIDGATVPCQSSTRAQGAQAAQSKSGSGGGTTNCRSDSAPAAKRDQNSYKSVITLSSAQ
jgi:hypothetical protein